MAEEAWLQQSVDFDIQSLLDFAENIRSTLEDFYTSLNTGILPLHEAGRFGEVVKEGVYFRDAHGLQVEAMQLMLEDVVRGLNALSMAAAAIAAEYQAGDALTQATVDDVWNAFTASLDPVLDGDSEDGQQASSDDEWSSEEWSDPEIEFAEPDERPVLDGSGRTLAEGTPGEFRIEADDEDVYGDHIPTSPLASESRP